MSLSGLDRVVADDTALLKGRRFGLLCNRASLNRHLVPAPECLAAAFPSGLQCLFSPQHGMWTEQQANMIETGHSVHPGLQVPIFSLYSATRRPPAERLEGLDALVIDVQDVGTRVYTYIWTLLYCLDECGRAGLPVIVLDRPNPLGGIAVEGPLLNPLFRSFVGESAIPMRHALTTGELAQLFNAELPQPAELTVVPMTGWDPTALPAWSGPWIPPSPNMPSLQTALVYPGQVLLEGVNLSEGRGTTTPFEVFGAPFIDPHDFCRRLNALLLPGATFLPCRFCPAFDKWKDAGCGGATVCVSDPWQFHSLRTTIAVLTLCRQMYASEFALNPPPYEYEFELAPLDIISGGDALRLWLTSDNCDPGSVPETLWRVDVDWNERTQPFRLYDRACRELLT